MASGSKLWSEIVVVTDEQAETKIMTARHEGDMTTRGFFHFDEEDGWQHEPDVSEIEEIQHPVETTYELYYRGRSGKYFRKGGGELPEIYLRNGKTDPDTDIWFRVRDVSSESLRIKEIGEHIYRVLGGDNGR
jgi:hypothetical protein